MKTFIAWFDENPSGTYTLEANSVEEAVDCVSWLVDADPSEVRVREA